ncbi:hypothetical protein BD770DRAFT_311961, partial [Pilaira anomala]
DGEIASASNSKKYKCYNNALKFALSTKQRLNHILFTLHGYIQGISHSIKLPIFQLMGIDCHNSLLNIIDKDVYALHEVYKFSFPRTN